MPESRPRARALEAALREKLAGEVGFDTYTRHLFSTDASMYAMEPIGVVFPRDRDDVQAAVEIAGRFGVPVLPRGAGTSLAGQTVGTAVVLDFSRYMTDIVAVDPEARTARVQPGVVQDDLNRAAAPHGLLFAPDTSTGNRATLGGMIGNNSCGARSARFGMTIDHVDALDVVLSDASAARFEALAPHEVARRAKGGTLESRLYRVIPSLVRRHARVIREALPSHWRRSGGYRLERLLPEAGPLNLARLVVGSEGTLALAVEATVRLVPRPAAIAALVGHFETVNDAIEAAPVALEEGATTVELVDKMILDLARHSPVHRHLASHIRGDPGAILWVEYYGEEEPQATAGMERLRARWAAEGMGYAVLAAPTAREQEGFRALRKAGLGLLMAAGTGGERSIAFVEDTAVAPARLAEYTRRLAGILDDHGLRAGFYGHASAGCLHIRPFMNLARPGEPARMRSVAEAVLALVTEFDGMNASEHGDGLARGEFNRRFFGGEFYRLMQEVKSTFDPRGRLNPGKKVDVPPMTEHLRDVALPPAPPLRTRFSFPEDGGMRGAANRCVRIGACRKSPGAGGTMCPTYMATRDEEHATRGRANALVSALSMPDPRAALGDARLHEILDLCLECKACKTECPLSVDMATLKSEALAHLHDLRGVPLRSRLFGHARILNRIGSALAPLSNLPGSVRPLRALLERAVGIDRRRPLPHFRRDTLPRWFDRFRARRSAGAGRSAGSGRGAVPERGPLLFLADSFTSFTEPEIGQAAIELLDAAGWDVQLVDDVCCGRSLISKGMLDEAWAGHRTLLRRLGDAAAEGTPIVGCEPSCILTLEDELPALARGSGTAEEARIARVVAAQARLVEDLLADAVEDGSLQLDPDAEVAGRPILFHGHCHQKSAGALQGSLRLLRAMPGATVEVLDAGCCGMAGSFGFEREHYDVSMTIGGQRLFPAVDRAPEHALVAATGVSCRQQIAQGTGRTSLHPALILRKAVRLR
ncbi:MAG: FAD-linked oxidase C-terminal domain-containing protein [Gemmatimonadota bacterium]|jgi:FAD/FMN-containing dehydrogenase/Fe-S oxidoreductase